MFMFEEYEKVKESGADEEMLKALYAKGVEECPEYFPPLQEVADGQTLSIQSEEEKKTEEGVNSPVIEDPGTVMDESKEGTKEKNSESGSDSKEEAGVAKPPTVPQAKNNATEIKKASDKESSGATADQSKAAVGSNDNKSAEQETLYVPQANKHATDIGSNTDQTSNSTKVETESGDKKKKQPEAKPPTAANSNEIQLNGKTSNASNSNKTQPDAKPSMASSPDEKQATSTPNTTGKQPNGNQSNTSAPTGTQQNGNKDTSRNQQGSGVNSTIVNTNVPPINPPLVNNVTPNVLPVNNNSPNVPPVVSNNAATVVGNNSTTVVNNNVQQPKNNVLQVASSNGPSPSPVSSNNATTVVKNTIPPIDTNTVPPVVVNSNAADPNQKSLAQQSVSNPLPQNTINDNSNTPPLPTPMEEKAEREEAKKECMGMINEIAAKNGPEDLHKGVSDDQWNRILELSNEGLLPKLYNATALVSNHWKGKMLKSIKNGNAKEAQEARDASLKVGNHHIPDTDITQSDDYKFLTAVAKGEMDEAKQLLDKPLFLPTFICEDMKKNPEKLELLKDLSDAQMDALSEYCNWDKERQDHLFIYKHMGDKWKMDDLNVEYNKTVEKMRLLNEDIHKDFDFAIPELPKKKTFLEELEVNLKGKPKSFLNLFAKLKEDRNYGIDLVLDTMKKLPFPEDRALLLETIENLMPHDGSRTAEYRNIEILRLAAFETTC